MVNTEFTPIVLKVTTVGGVEIFATTFETQSEYDKEVGTNFAKLRKNINLACEVFDKKGKDLIFDNGVEKVPFVGGRFGSIFKRVIEKLLLLQRKDLSFKGDERSEIVNDLMKRVEYNPKTIGMLGVLDDKLTTTDEKRGAIEILIGATLPVAIAHLSESE